jgi:DNA-binding CsgD family transcriptional regulator
MKSKLPVHAGRGSASSTAEVYPDSRPGLAVTRKISCPLGAAIFSKQAWEEIARSLKLSGRELQIIKDVFDDRTESAIAVHYGVSPHTIHTYCERLYRKLAVTDRVKLVLRVTNEFLALTAATDGILPSICANRTAGRCPLRRD